MNIFRKVIKKGYYSFLDPAWRKLKCEILDELHARNQVLEGEVRERSQGLMNEVINSNQILKNEIFDEIHRARQLDAELHTSFTQQVADEIIRLNKLINKLQNEETNRNLPVIIVDELIKIHQSLERLNKH